MTSILEINGLSLIAEKLVNAVNIELSGDTTGTVSFDGSSNINIVSSLANTNTARNNLGLGNVATLNTGILDGTVPIIGANGKLDSSIIPAIAITDIYVNTNIVETTEELALTSLKSYVLGLNTQVGDIVIYTYSWTSEPIGSISNTILQSTEYDDEDTDEQKWAKWKSFITPASAEVEILSSLLRSHIGSNGVDTHAIATSEQAGFMPNLSNVSSNVLDGTGNWTNHIGIGGNAVHPVSSTTNEGFLPALPNISGNTKILSGIGTWIDIPESVTKITTTGATTGEMTKVGTHWGIAISSTVVIAAGVATYGTDLSIGTSVYVDDSDGTVYYYLPSSAGQYVHIGIVKSSSEISISEVQIKYTII